MLKLIGRSGPNRATNLEKASGKCGVKRCLALAVAVVLGAAARGSPAGAQESAPREVTTPAVLAPAAPAPAADPLSLTPAYLQATGGAAAGSALAPEGEAPRRPLMELLRRAGVGDALERAHLQVYGYIEGSYAYNFDRPRSGQNTFRLFDLRDQKLLMNQLNLTVERPVNYKNATQWDVGGKMAWIYGADAGFIHSHGLFDYYDSPFRPQNQVDLTEAYLDVVVPVGTGLRVRLGKFVNLVGYEAIDPTVTTHGITDFYSRSFVFGLSYPFTHTGIIGTYDVTRAVTVTAGVTRGDDQSTRDNNGSVSFIGAVNWDIIPKTLGLYVSNSTGPEQPRDNKHYRTTTDATLYYFPTDRWSVAANGYYVWDAAGTPTGRSGSLFSLSGITAYKVNDYLLAKGRFEWYHDNDALRAPLGTDLYGLTVGVTVTPFPHDFWGQNLKLRPELRWDYSEDRVFNGRSHQLTASIDAVFKL